MSLMFSASVKVKHTRGTNLGTKYPSYVPPQVLFLVPVHFATNMTAIRLRESGIGVSADWKNIKRLAADRGYRGKKEINGTQILIPDIPKAKDTYHQRKKKHQLFCKRAGIEPTIGHLKTDYRLGRNFYKGLFGDAINVMSAAAYNFKRAMKVLLCLLQKISDEIFYKTTSLKYAF